MSVSIIIPTYNRKKFEALIEHNINIQTYTQIVEVIVLDDSDVDRPLSLKVKYPVRYYNIARCTIGYKRTLGVSLATGEYVAHVDTDDMYDANYIAYSIFEMQYHNKSISGSADMCMYNGKDWYKQRCMFLHLLNEATMVYKKSICKGFGDSNSNEAVPFLEACIGDIIETDIDKVMCCLCHSHNTIPKGQWLTETFKSKPLTQYKTHLDILSQITL